jgi:energy-coupling factor transport system ATP-binding protein
LSDGVENGLVPVCDGDEIVLLLGPSGAGKSTLLPGLAGLLGGAEDGLEAGRPLVDGAPPSRKRSHIGMVLQDLDSQVILSRVDDDVAFWTENVNVPRDEIWPRVAAALDAVGLHVPLNHKTSELSGGQKQRLALAGVIAMNPGLILLDEPTANLDLVFAVRRGSKLATAMEARGFGAYPTRTWARSSTFARRELALIAAGIVIAAVAISVFVATGALNFIGTR